MSENPLRVRLRLMVQRGGRARHRSVLGIREGGRTIVVLVLLLVAMMVALYVVGRIDTMRRSGTAAADIVSSEFQPGGGIEQTPTGSWIRYTYVVEETIYTGFEFRRWRHVADHNPKVCFEPANPANHLLVGGRIRCGVDGGA